jgi:hypothetical protein
MKRSVENRKHMVEVHRLVPFAWVFDRSKLHSMHWLPSRAWTVAHRGVSQATHHHKRQESHEHKYRKTAPLCNFRPLTTQNIFAMASLVQQARRTALRQFAKQLQDGAKQSVFAIGGSVPIISLPSQLICESDDNASETGSVPAAKQCRAGEGAAEDPMSIDFLVGRDSGTSFSNLTDTSHNIRCDPVTIRWDSIDDAKSSYKVSLPCSDDDKPAFEQLLRDCQPATFGRAGKNVLDETYRKAGKLDAASFCTNFNLHNLCIIDTITHALAPSMSVGFSTSVASIRAELYKLNVRASYPT